jgi:Domain of unknown function (DUF4349)
MDATIGYVSQVREDLMDAAFRTGRARPGARGGRRWLPSRRVAVALASVLVFVAAGTLGWFLNDTDGVDRIAAERPASGATGATGATGGTPRERAIARDHGQADAAMPAPAAAEGYTFGNLSERTSMADEQAGGDAGFEAPAVEESIAVRDPSRIIRTAQMTVEIPRDSFDEKFAEAQGVAEVNGGFVQTSTGAERSGTLTMRVPSKNFASAMDGLRALGDVKLEKIQGQDVTAEYVDLQGRLKIGEARLDVLFGLMEQAVSIEQTIRVQNALDDTQLRVENLQGQIKLLRDRTSFATIRALLREEGVKPKTEVVVKNPSLPTAWDRAIAGFIGVIAGVVIGLGYLIPILVVATAVWFAVRLVRRRRAAA